MSVFLLFGYDCFVYRASGRAPRDREKEMAKEWAKSFYNSSQWKVARGIALRRDYFTCQLCDSRAEEVHHVIELTPENIHDINIALNPDNLMSLCHDCHTKRTAGDIGDITEGYCFDENGMVVPTSPPVQ